MAKSTQMIADQTSVITNGPNAATTAKANAQGGKLMDYPGNNRLSLLHLQETTVLLTKVLQDTDSTDATNLALLQGVQALLLGTSSPSTQALTDLQTVYNNGPNAATTAKANAQGGPLMDYPGNVKTLKRKLEEDQVLLTSIVYDTDSTDATNLALLQGLVNVLV